MCVVIVNENGSDNRLKLTMLAEYAVRQCANGRAKVLAPGRRVADMRVTHPSQNFLLLKSPGFLVCGRRSRAESKRNRQQTSA